MFETDLVLAADPRADLWRLAAPLVWKDKTYGRLVAPVGFVTDLASTPFHVDDNGPSRRPAAMHDCMYKLLRRLGKDFADQFLRDAIVAEGGGKVRAQVYYRAVSWFGSKAWRSDGAPVSAADFDTIANFEAWRASKAIGASLARPGFNLS
jgi:hypothetical protein